MFANYLLIAIRNLTKYRLFSMINIIGLAIGLCVFLLSFILAEYESNHDHMFDNRSRTFTISSQFSATSGQPISEFPNIRLAYGPLIKEKLPQAEQVVRTMIRERIVTVNPDSNEKKHSYQNVRFVESGFTDTFNFTYLHGDKNALVQPHGVIITEQLAIELFGTTKVLNKPIVLNHGARLNITAVIQNVGFDSHFNSSMLPNHELALIAPLQSLVLTKQFPIEGEWTSLQPGDLTYILMPSTDSEQISQSHIQKKIDEVYQKFTPKDEQAYISGLKVRRLIDANTQVWDSLRFPVIGALQLFGLLILLISCLNYANLATAQSFSRTREIGLRKAFGAEQSQLLFQFLIESILITSIAMVIALACLEIIIPTINATTNKALILNYVLLAPQALFVTVVIGIIAGAYPAYLIMKKNTLDSLQNKQQKGRNGVFFRQAMICLQFAISLFILSVVSIVYFQNEKVLSLSSAFLNKNAFVINLTKLDYPTSFAPTLKGQLAQLSNVKHISLSSDTPFNGINETVNVSSEYSNQAGIELLSVAIDEDFNHIYKNELVHGSKLKHTDLNQPLATEVLINQFAAQLLGFKEESLSVGQQISLVSASQNFKTKTLVIKGVLKNEYFLGVHMKMHPMLFYALQTDTDNSRYLSIEFNQTPTQDTLDTIEKIWNETAVNHPLRIDSLTYYFKLFFRIPVAIQHLISTFAGIAVALAFIGLFGITAFLTQRRAKEIGLRKIMGASTLDIITLLIWQISKPIFVSLVVSMPLSYWASSIYLKFFPEQVANIFGVICIASSFTLLLAWLIIGIYANNIANSTPISTLKSE